MRRTKVLVTITLGSLIGLTGCGGSSGAGNAEKFCDLAEEANSAGDDVSAALDDGSARKIKRAMNDALESYEAAAKLAPKEIKDDVETVRQAQDDLVSLFEKHDFDIAEASSDKDFEDLTSDQSIQDASDAVDEYLNDECGIDTSNTDDTAADTTEGGGSDITDVAETTVDTVEVVDTEVDTTEATGTVELSAEVGGTTVGTEDSPTVVYGALITNTTDQPASNLSINFTMFDDGGTVVGTSTGYTDLILPGETRAITGTTTVTAPAARIEATYSGDIGMPYGTEEGDLPTGEFTFEGTQLKTDDYSTGVLGLLKSTYPVDFQNVEVDVIFRGADNQIIGGGSTYVGVLANNQVGVEPSAYYQIPGVASFELYGSYSIYELTD